MANNQLALLSKSINMTEDELVTLQQTLATGTSPEQFSLYIRTAVTAGLNPFLNHIFAIVYQGKMSLQISVEGIVYLAKKVPGYQGIDAQVVCENDEFKAARVDGEWLIEKHDVTFPRGKIIAAYAVAYRENFRPFTVLIDFSEVEHFQRSSIPNQKTMWEKYTADMFKKHVTKRAAKGQFGIDVSEEDMPTVGGSDIPAYTSPAERRDITHEVDQATAAQQQPDPTPPTTHSNDPEADAIAAMKEKFDRLGHTTKAAKEQYLKDNSIKWKGATPTLAELKGVLKMMDLHIEEKERASAANDDLLDDDPLK